MVGYQNSETYVYNVLIDTGKSHIMREEKRETATHHTPRKEKEKVDKNKDMKREEGEEKRRGFSAKSTKSSVI